MKSKPLHKLKQLSVSKVSLVPKGSNPESHVTFFKSADPVAKATFAEIMAGEVLRGTLYKIYNSCYTMQDAIYSAMNGEGDTAAQVRQSIGEFKAYVDGLLDELSAGGVKKSKVNVEKLAKEFVAKHNAWLDAVKENVMKKDAKTAPVAKALKDMSPEELLAHAEGLTQQNAELVAKAAKQPAPATDPDEDEDEDEDDAISEEVLRSMPESAQAVIKSLQAQNKALTLTSKATADAVARMEEERQIDRMVAVARREIPHLPGTDEEKGEMLHTLQKTLPKKAYEDALARMKAGSAAVAKSLVEIGNSGDGPAADTPMGQLNVIAKQMQTADPKLTSAQAFDRACLQNPHLYAESRDERFGTTRRRAN